MGTAANKVMSNSSTIARRPDARLIRPEEWNSFLAEFTREYRGAHARLEVIGATTDTGYQVETEDQPFEGASADTKDRERTVWITFGSRPKDHLSHGVERVTAIRMLEPSQGRGAVLEVETADGTKNILELSGVADFALPPGEKK